MSSPETSSSYFCYLLVTENGMNTYVGATVDIERRLRQHNHELVGGARATSIQLAKGQIWKRVCYVSGMPDWRSALQIEWRWKQLGRTKHKSIRHPVQRRLFSLHTLLSMERPTTAAMPYKSYSSPPMIYWDMDYWKEWYYTQFRIPTMTKELFLCLLSDKDENDQLVADYQPLENYICDESSEDPPQDNLINK